MSSLQQTAAPSSVRTFIDLRQFEQDRSQGIPRSAAPGEDLFLGSRRLLDFPDGPVSAGVIALEAGSGAVQSHPADEFIFVSSGTLTLSQAQPGRMLELGPNSSAVIQHGAAFSWSAEGPVSVIFMRYTGSQPDERAIVPIREKAPLAPSNPPSAELLISPAPSCRNHSDHRSGDGQFSCGVWDSTPYHRRAMYYRHYELMYLLAGSVTFVDETGRSATFAQGDLFMVEQHASCSWESREYVAKVFALYRPV
ncbi:MAG TPA: cupin domain-containing protein [Telluria sp.]|nr:cupin domain-containing protein [Telluria sp.]